VAQDNSQDTVNVSTVIPFRNKTLKNRYYNYHFVFETW
jgi:hypothetical protein